MVFPRFFVVLNNAFLYFEYNISKLSKTLICPRRHTASFFDLGSSEQKIFLNPIDEIKTKILENDKTVTGFNVGVNRGEATGQTIFHRHIHLIPRRKERLLIEGGIRNIMPDKGKWK